jgi:hypothetical protein
MAKARKPSPAAKSNLAGRAKGPSKRRADRLVNLSIATGDPLQPGGLTEYLAAIGDTEEQRRGAAKASRGEALKAAQARWSNRQKVKNGKV